MRFAEQDRRVMFCTPRPAQQLQRFLARRSTHSAPLQEVRDLFSDLSRGAFMSLMISSRRRGLITFDDEVVTLDRPDIQPSYADVIWKDIRMLRTFTFRDVVEDTGINEHTVRKHLAAFVRQGLVEKRRTSVLTPAMYVLLSDSVVRPLARRPRGSTVADMIYSIVRSTSGLFSRATVEDELRRHGVVVERRYVSEMLRRLCTLGFVERLDDGRRGCAARYERRMDMPADRPILPTVFQGGRR